MSTPAPARPAPSAPPLVLYAILLALSLLPIAGPELKFLLLSATTAVGALLLGAGGRLVALPSRPLARSAALLLGWACLTAIWAPDRYRAVTALLWLLALALVAMAFLHAGERTLAGIARITLALGLGELLLGLAQYTGYLPRPQWANQIRLAGSFVNSNIYASWCTVLLLLAAGTLIAKGIDRGTRVLAAAVLLAAALSLPLTVSRGGWMAAAAGVVVLALGGRLGRGRRLPGARGLLLAGIAMMAVLVALATVGGARVWERLSHAGSYSLSHRAAIWLGTLDLIRAHPWGVGLGGFEPDFPAHQIHSDRFLVNFAHSDLLELLAVLGVPGLVLTACLLRPAMSGESLRRLASRPLAWASFAALCALATGSLWDFPLRKPTLALFVAATVGALASRAEQEAELPLRAGVLAGTALLLCAALPLLHGERLRASAGRLEAAHALGPSELAYRRADRWLWPGDPALARAAANMNLARARAPLVGSAFLGRARDWFLVTCRRAPTDAGSALGLAVALSAGGDRAAARPHYLSSAALAPRDGGVLRAAAEGLFVCGDRLASYRLEARALDTSPERSRPDQIASAARRLALPPESVALAPPPNSPRRLELARALEQEGLLLASRLYQARGESR